MPGTSDAVLIFSYPVLVKGNMSFPEGEYDTEFEIGSDGYSATVVHKVRGAPLIETLVNERRAACSCVLSIPITGYRRFFKGDTFRQKINWQKDWVGEPPVIRPLILCSEDMEYTLSEEDGVHEEWVDRKIFFKKGMKIALGDFVRLTSSMESLLSVEKDDLLEPGQMSVRPCSEHGFYFQIRVASDLYAFLQKWGGEDRYLHRRSILTHAVSAGFSLLAKDYGKSEGEGEDVWQSYANLRALASEMESKGLEIWDTENFCPEEAATKMYPHRIPIAQDDDV